MGFPQLPDRGDPQVLSSLSTGPLDNPPEMSNIGSLTPATGRRPWACLVSRVKWGWFFVSIRRSRASLLRSLTLKLLVAGMLAMVFTVAGMSANAKPAAAGAFPALLDRNAGAVMSPLSIHNLYWDTDWNTHNPGESMQQIDDATMAMVSSGYFAKLGQYGVASATFDGSHQADPSCGGAGSSVDYFNISGFVLCEKHFFNLAPGLVYMVYAPVTAGFSMLGATSCNPATGVAGFGGFHFQTLFSVIPPDVPQVFGIDFAQCTTGLDGATQTGAHEIVEAATDPLPPFDWIDNSVVTSISIAGVGALFTAGEAADLCESGVGSPAPAPNPPTSADPRVTGTLGNYAVAYYWSNADGACVPLPDTIMLDQTGLPTAGHATFDGSTVTLPFTTTVADNTTHSFSFPSPVPDPGNPAGIRYVTSQPSFSGVVTSSISVIATYTQQFFLTVTTNPAFLRPLDVSLTPSGWFAAGSTVLLATDAIIGVGPTERWRFDSWTGAIPGAGTSATVLMTAPKTAVAGYLLQHLVSFAETGIPAGVPWSITVNGTAHAGPFSDWFDDGTTISFVYQAVVADPSPGTRYVNTGSSPSSPIVAFGPVSVVGTYQTQHLLTISTLGLGTSITHIFNGGSLLGTATDATPLAVWLPHGTALSLSADAIVSAPGGVQLFFQGFAPAPPASLLAPFATTASYTDVAQLISGGLASGAIDNAGVAHSLAQKFADAQADIAAGRHKNALNDLRAFIQHVEAQSGHHVDPILASELELDALLAYHQEICAALAAGQITPAQATNDYAFYATRVTTLGGTPLSPC